MTISQFYSKKFEKISDMELIISNHQTEPCLVSIENLRYPVDSPPKTSSPHTLILHYKDWYF